MSSSQEEFEIASAFIRVIYSAKKSDFGQSKQRLRNLTDKINSRDKALTMPWVRYFHGNPDILTRINDHYLVQGKKVCIQYCKNDPLLEKANYCSKSLSLT